MNIDSGVDMDASPSRVPIISVKNLGLFQFMDVLGDGKSFFNALVLLLHLNIECPFELRVDILLAANEMFIRFHKI